VNDDVELYRNALLVLLTTLGIPHLFYGSEVALAGNWLQEHHTTPQKAIEESVDSQEYREPLWHQGYSKVGVINGTFMYDAVHRMIEVGA